MPQIEVNMKIEGLDIRVHVIAEDKATKKSRSIRAELKYHFSREQMERLERKANELEEELRKEEERVDARKKLQSFIFSKKRNIINNNGPDELALAEEIDSGRQKED